MSAKTTEAGKKSQWNTRITPEYRRTAKIVSAMTDYSQDELAELGLALLFGVDEKKDKQAVEALNRCCTRVRAAAKRTGEPLPIHQFTTFTRYGSCKANGEREFSFMGAVSSVVEHILHTDGVAGSKPAPRTISKGIKFTVRRITDADATGNEPDITHLPARSLHHPSSREPQAAGAAGRFLRRRTA